MTGCSDVGYAELLLTLRENNVMDTDVMKFLIDDESEQSDNCIRLMLERPADYKYQSTFEELVHARLAIESPFVEFTRDPLSSCWLAQQRVAADTNRKASPKEQLDTMRKSLRVFLSEFEETRNLLDGRRWPLSDAAVMALHGYERNWARYAHCDKSASTIRNLLPSFMTVEFRRNIAKSVALFVKQQLKDTRKPPILTAATAKQIYQENDMAVLRPLLDDVQYHRFTRGCFGPMAEYLMKNYPLSKTGEEAKLLRGKSRSEVITLPLDAEVDLPPEDTIDYVDATFQCQLHRIFLPAAMERRAKTHINTVPFLPGLGGRENVSHMRVVSNQMQPTGFFTSNHWYPSTLFEPFEAEMKDHVQKFLNVQNDFVRRKCNGKYSFGEWKVNMIQILVSLAKTGSYAEHDDSGCLLNRLAGSIEPNDPSLQDGKISQAEAQWLLPSRAVQQTITYVQSSMKLDNSKVRWKDPSSSNNAIVGELATADNVAHLQGTRSQLMKHDVQPLEILKFHPRLEWRAVWSFRATFCPVMQPHEYKEALGNQLAASTGMPDVSSLPGPELYESDKAVTGVLKHLLDPKMASANDSDDSDATKKPKKSKKKSSGSRGHGRKRSKKSGRGKSILGGRKLPTRKKDSNDDSSEEEDSDNSAEEESENQKEENTATAVSRLETCGYRRMTETQFWNLGYENVGQSFSLEGPDWFNLSGAHAIKMLLAQGCVGARNCLEYTKDGASRRRVEQVVMRNILYTPNLNSAEAEARGEFDGRFPSPGEIFRLSRISSDAGNPHTKRAHRLIGTDDRCANVLILTHAYKNGDEAVMRAVYAIVAQKAVENGTASAAEREYAKKRHNDLFIYGSGGSPTPKGTHCPILDKDTRDMSYASFPTGQDPDSDINRKLINLVHMNAVVAVFVNLQKFFGKTEATRILKKLNCTTQFLSDAAMFVNYYSMDNLTYGQDWFTGDRRPDGQPIDYLDRKMILVPDCRDKKALQASEEMDRLVRSGYGYFTMFHQVPNCRFNLKTAFNDDEAKILQTRDLKLLRIPTEKENSISVAFSSNFSANKLLDPANTIRINRRILLSIWIQGGQWKEYANCQADDDNGNDQYDNNADCGEQVTTWDFSAKREELVKLTPREVNNACLFMCAAVAMRLLKKSLVKEDRGWVATALPPEMEMPNPLSLNATPCPIRTMDAIPLSCVSAGTEEGLVEERSGPNDQRDRRAVLNQTPGAKVDTLAKHIFMSTAWRVTGRVNSVAVYRSWSGKQGWMPGPDGVEDFLQFVDSVCDYSCDESMRHFRSAQHEESIMSPLAFRKGIRHFLTEFAGQVKDLAETMITSGSRREALVNLAGAFHRCTIGDDTEKNTVNCIWIAGEVLADVEEVFNDPFGEVTSDSIPRGTGSKAGMKYIQTQKEGNGKPKAVEEADEEETNEPTGQKRKRTKKNKTKKRQHVPLKTKSTDARVQACDRMLTKMENDEFDAIATEMLEDLHSRSKEELAVMFLFRRDDGKVCVSLTGRPVNKKDMEMETCKVSVSRALVLPVRSVTVQPTCYSRHCHPVPTYNFELPWDNIISDILQLANGSIAAFIVARTLAMYPAMLLYVGEKGDRGQRKLRSEEDKKKREEFDRKKELAQKERRKKAARGKKGSQKDKEKTAEQDESSVDSGEEDSVGNKSQKSQKSTLPFARQQEFPPAWMDADDGSKDTVVEIENAAVAKESPPTEVVVETIDDEELTDDEEEEDLTDDKKEDDSETEDEEEPPLKRVAV